MRWNLFLPALVAALQSSIPAPAAETDPTSKPLVKRLKAVSIDPKLGEIKVREADFEVFWRKDVTRFYRHRSVPLKDIEKGAAIHVLGRLHARRRDPQAGPGETLSRITDIVHIGAGNAFIEPPLTPKTGFIRWHAGSLASTVLPFHLKVGQEEYALSGDEKLAAYSLEKLKPENVAGAAVLIRGDARKVTVERNGKARQVTRLIASEVHLVELSPEHLKVFQAQWGEKRKEPVPAPEGGAGASAKGKDRKDRQAPAIP